MRALRLLTRSTPLAVDLDSSREGIGDTRTVTRQDDVAHFLATGEHHDPTFSSWPGQNVLESCRLGGRTLREALVREVARRAQGVAVPEIPIGDPLASVTPRLEAMVTGLVPRKVRERTVAHLLGSVTFLLPTTIESALTDVPFLHTVRR